MRILSYTVCGVNNLFKKKMKKKLIELKNREKKIQIVSPGGKSHCI